MGFISYSLNWYEAKLNGYEGRRLGKDEIYEAKQLLKMLDDLVDEGYTELSTMAEDGFACVTRLHRLLAAYNETPFPLVELPCGADVYADGSREVGEYIAGLVGRAESRGEESGNEFIDELAVFCDWLPDEAGSAQVFLLRDALLPYIYLEHKSKAERYPWIIGRRFMDILRPGGHIDDIVRGTLFDALDAGCADFDSLLRFCRPLVLDLLSGYPAVLDAVRGLLGAVKAEHVMVVESGCYGTFPLLLAALDERVDFRMFTTVPFLTGVYAGRIYTGAYEKNRLFETLCSQDHLMRLTGWKDGRFYVSENTDEEVVERSLGEIRRVVRLASDRQAVASVLPAIE